jgi:hypothetical protein
MVGLIGVTALAVALAWNKLKVGPPAPKMAIEEAKKIQETIQPGPGS